MPGYVVHESAVEFRPRTDDTVAARLTIDSRAGCEHLEQHVLRFGPGRSQTRGEDAREELLYVVAGTGTLLLDGEPHGLEPEMGVHVAAGRRYEIENDGPDELVLVSVTAPEPDAGEEGGRPVTVRYADQPILPAGKDREFRYVVQTSGATQFVGSIPPGRAKDHYHLYDEVVYILDGEGILHLDGQRDTPISAGSCIHLPPPLVHCLENTGSGPLRVLGVFHPAGSPAEAYNTTPLSERGGDSG